MNSLREAYDTLIVLDTETTGFSPVRDEIIEIGAVRYRNDGASYVPDGRLSCLISLSPGRCLPKQITELTGITPAMLTQSGIPKDEAAMQLCALLCVPNALLAAYNAQFDLSFLYYFLARCGCADCLRQLRFLDVLTVYRDRRPYPHRLTNAIDAYQLNSIAENSHRAIDDAMATLYLLQAMGEERDDLNQYINLFGVHPKFGVSGKPIRSIRYWKQPLCEHLPLYELARDSSDT